LDFHSFLGLELCYLHKIFLTGVEEPFGFASAIGQSFKMGAIRRSSIVFRVVLIVRRGRILILRFYSLGKIMNFSFFPQAENRSFVSSDCSFSL